MRNPRGRKKTNEKGNEREGISLSLRIDMSLAIVALSPSPFLFYDAYSYSRSMRGDLLLPFSFLLPLAK